MYLLYNTRSSFLRQIVAFFNSAVHNKLPVRRIQRFPDMKFIPILKLFACFSLNFIQLVDCNKCMVSQFKPLGYAEFEKTFTADYSFFYYLKSLFVGNNASRKEKNNLKQLCACAIQKIEAYKFKLPGDSARSFSDILEEIKTEKGSANLTVPSYICYSMHKFPVTRCLSAKNDEQICSISKGLHRKSNNLYDLYVAGKGNLVNYQGVLEDIDVELPAN